MVPWLMDDNNDLYFLLTASFLIFNISDAMAVVLIGGATFPPVCFQELRIILIVTRVLNCRSK